jgi:glutamyl-Q tRNA(Asp) synthetase
VNVARSSTAIGTTATVKRGRFAPSPTGRLHLGSLLAAVGSYLDARHQGGEWLVRIEDIDRAREVPGAADDILRTLEQFGLTWDGPVLYQHTRTDAYRAALDTLSRDHKVYRCDCERRAYTPLAFRGEARYPGRCRDRTSRPFSPFAVRLDTRGTLPVTITDRLQAPLTQDVEAEVGDFVLWRKDGFPAYQLAVVIDDAAQGISSIVRGDDLYDNTPRQCLLQQALGLHSPDTLHLPLLMDTDGQKLSKSRRSLPVDTETPGVILTQVLTLLGQALPASFNGAPPTELLAYAVAHWDPHPLRGQRRIVLDEDPTRSVLLPCR